MPTRSHSSEAVAALRQWLKTSGNLPGSRLPSERTLAKELGFTHYAMNRAMARLVEEGLVIREGYKLQLASSPAQGNPRFTCELVLARRSIFLPVYKRLARELRIPLNVHRWESAEEAVSIMKKLVAQPPEAVIYNPPAVPPFELWHGYAHSLIKAGVPVVRVGKEMPGVTSVGWDHIELIAMALQHLRELGHEEVAMVDATSRSVWLEEPNLWKRICEREGFASSSKRVMFLEPQRFMDQDLQNLARCLTREWAEVTGVLWVIYRLPPPGFLEELAHAGRHVPNDLSIIFSPPAKALMSGSTLSSVDTDMNLVLDTVFSTLQRMHRRRETTGLLPATGTILIRPELAPRATTAPRNQTPPQRPPAAETPPPFQAVWNGKPAELRRHLQMMTLKPYPRSLRAQEARFRQLDLAEHVNRPLNFRRGWLGDLPLKYFTAGRHVIHGVPFEVLGGTSPTASGAVVFQSSINATGKAKKLPARASIPIGGRAEAVYFLHGCGYAKFLHEFAAYSFYSGEELLDRVPLIALGHPDVMDPDTSRFRETANIQDWWPDYPHIDFAQGRMAPIVENPGEEALPRHVYLYTLEWVNPRPEAEVTHVEITVDITQATTLGLLAASVLIA
jgi:DNA-binding LacI/PurR family transcriptional regulator